MEHTVSMSHSSFGRPVGVDGCGEEKRPEFPGALRCWQVVATRATVTGPDLTYVHDRFQDHDRPSCHVYGAPVPVLRGGVRDAVLRRVRDRPYAVLTRVLARPGVKTASIRCGVVAGVPFPVRKRGLEPPRPKTLEPKSSASANSATRARTLAAQMRPCCNSSATARPSGAPIPIGRSRDPAGASRRGRWPSRCTGRARPSPRRRARRWSG